MDIDTESGFIGLYLSRRVEDVWVCGASLADANNAPGVSRSVRNTRRSLDCCTYIAPCSHFRVLIRFSHSQRVAPVN